MRTLTLLAFVVVSAASLFLGYHFGVEDTMDAYKSTPEEKQLLTRCMQQNSQWVDIVLRGQHAVPK